MLPSAPTYVLVSRSRASSTVSLPTPPTSIRKRARSKSDDEDQPPVEQGPHKRQRVWHTPPRPYARTTCHGIALESNPGRAFPSPPSSDPAPVPTTPTRRSPADPAIPHTPPLRKQPICDTPNNVFLSSRPVLATRPEDVTRNLGPADQRGEIPAMVYLL